MRRKTAVLMATAIMSAAGLMAACSGKPAGQGAGPPGGMAPPVPVAQVVTRQLAPSSEFNGFLAAPKTVELRPRVGGAIVAVSVPEGGLVRQGQLLFQIDPRPFQVALDTALAQLRQAEALAAQGQSEFDRAERLVATGAVSKKVFDDAQAQRRASQAGVQAAQAAVAAARLDLSFTRVTAPISGRVDRALVTEGNLVTASGAPTLLTTILSVDPVHVLFDLDETTYLSFAREARAAGRGGALPVQVGLMTDKTFPYEGRLDFVGNGVDRASGTVKARAVVANPGGQLTPGLFARVKLVTGQTQQTVLIDDQAVAADQGRNFVLVLGAGNKAEYRPIELGPVVEGLRVVKAGLKSGETIIIKGLVRPGMQVTPRKVAMQAGVQSAQTASAEARQ